MCEKTVALIIIYKVKTRYTVGGKHVSRLESDYHHHQL